MWVYYGQVKVELLFELWLRLARASIALITRSERVPNMCRTRREHNEVPHASGVTCRYIGGICSDSPFGSTLLIRMRRRL
jgi:hypothetical protein